MPLLYPPTLRSFASRSATWWSASSALRRHSGSSKPDRRRSAIRNWSPVRCSQNASMSGQRPTRWKASGEPQAGAPRSFTSPWLGASWPAASFRNVDLPAPFGPRSPVTPGETLTVTSLSAITDPYQRDARVNSRQLPEGVPNNSDDPCAVARGSFENSRGAVTSRSPRRARASGARAGSPPREGRGRSADRRQAPGLRARRCRRSGCRRRGGRSGSTRRGPRAGR